MKTLITLLASTSLCFAASVGVSEDQLRGSGVHPGPMIHPPAVSGPTDDGIDNLERMPQNAPELWSLVAMFHYDDGSESGVEVSRTIHQFMSQDLCQAEKTAHENGARAAKVTLECRHEVGD